MKKFGVALALSLALSACSVQLVEPYDKKIDDGLTAYQKALEKFTISTNENYLKCLGNDVPACAAASFKANKESFYQEQQAALRVLKTRAQALDSLGYCAEAFKFATSIADKHISDPELLNWIRPYKTGQASPNNCTELGINTIIDNQKLMGESHAILDGMPSQQASQQVLSFNALQTFHDTLIQNIKIALFLENAKKR